MLEIENQIKIHEANINQLTNSLNTNLNIQEKFNISEKINLEKEFLISLYKIKGRGNYTKEKPKNINPTKSDNKLEKETKKPQKFKNKRSKSINQTENKYLYKFENNNINENNKISFLYQFENKKLVTKLYKKIAKANFIYYECSKRRYGCTGICKYDTNSKKWFMIEECNSRVIHDAINFGQFSEDFKAGKLKDHNMSYKKYQEYYTKYLFINNEIKNYNDVLYRFKNNFACEFKLSQKEIIDIKYLAVGKNNRLDFYSLCIKIQMEEEQKFQVSVSDIVYKISINNKEVERNEKIVILTTKKMREILKDINISNYFIDIIYKIIPYTQKPYKLMNISAVNENTNITNICCLLGLFKLILLI